MPDHVPTGPRRRAARQPGAGARESRVLQQALWAVLAVAVIGISLFAGSLFFGRDDAPSSSASPSITPMTSDPATPSSPSGSPTASSSASASPEPTAKTMTAFLSEYLDAVADDPAIAWGKLTPGFQRTSGGFSQYRSFWAPIAGAEPSDIRADPKARTIAYDVTYTYADGHTTEDSTRLTVAYDDGSYRISGEG